MSTELIPALMAALVTVAAAVPTVRWWRRGRRLAGVLAAVVAVGAALIAMRDLPEPVVVGLLLAALGVVAVITAWPLLAHARRRTRTEGNR